MKNNVLQTILLAVIGFAILFVGFLLFISSGGENEPALDARLEELFGVFAGLADFLGRILRGVVGLAIMWVGYKVYPFKDEIEEKQSNKHESLNPISNE